MTTKDTSFSGRESKRTVEVACRSCGGRGFYTKVLWPKGKAYRTYDDVIRKKAFALFEQGKSTREIARTLKLNHPQTAKNLVDQYAKKFLSVSTKKQDTLRGR